MPPRSIPDSTASTYFVDRPVLRSLRHFHSMLDNPGLRARICLSSGDVRLGKTAPHRIAAPALRPQKPHRCHFLMFSSLRWPPARTILLRAMTTKVATGADYRAYPGLALLLCHCGKWAFRVDSHFPLFDPGLGAERPPVGCPIDWHVVPTPDPPWPASIGSEESILPATIDPDLVRAIHGRQLLAYEQGGEVPGTIIADDLVFLNERI
jgi:hypothetical protein